MIRTGSVCAYFSQTVFALRQSVLIFYLNQRIRHQEESRCKIYCLRHLCGGYAQSHSYLSMSLSHWFLSHKSWHFFFRENPQLEILEQLRRTHHCFLMTNPNREQKSIFLVNRFHHHIDPLSLYATKASQLINNFCCFHSYPARLPMSLALISYNLPRVSANKWRRYFPLSCYL